MRDFNDDDFEDHDINPRPAPKTLNSIAERAWRRFNKRKAIGIEPRRKSHDDSEFE